MPSFTLGQAAYVNKGNYNAGTNYAPLNTVYADGGTWVALRSVSGVAPGTDASAWLCITQGIKSLNVAAGNTGFATITVVLTDGTSSSSTFPVGDIGDGTLTVDKLASGFLLPADMGGTGRTNGAQAPLQKATVTLTAAGWDSTAKTQSVTITGMTAASEFIAQPSDKAGWIAAQSATLYPPTAGANSLTFECAAVPGADIPVTVYWWNP